MLGHVVFLASLLGVASFVVGLVPVALSLSRKNLARLSVFGTGLLLGAALGIVIPEGIETIYDHASPGAEPSPTRLALALLTGFTLMLSIEQLSHGSHQHAERSSIPLSAVQSRSDTPVSHSNSPRASTSITDGDYIEADMAFLQDYTPHRDPKLVTLGLVIHSLADGLALGASLAPPQTNSRGFTKRSDTDGSFSGLPLVVFFALALHKAPAALALTTALSTPPNPLSPRAVRVHLLIFSAAAPVAAVITYLFLVSVTPFESSPSGDWTGLALLFSGGTFLYVATSLFSSHHTHVPGEPSPGEDANLSPKGQLALTLAGMYAPVALVSFIGHGHG